MSKILLFGDSLPLFTLNAAITNEIAEQLRSHENEVYLLSKAWCTVTEENFYGNAEQNCTQYPFKKRFYLDPIQIRRSKGELLTSMLGLAIKAIDEERIDFLVFADDLSYLPLVELIHARRAIPCFLFMFDIRRNYECLVDNYMISGLDLSLQAFDAIYSFPGFGELLSQLFHIPEEKVILASPLPIKILETDAKSCKRDRLYILTDSFSTRRAKLAFSVGKAELQDEFREILICTPNGADDAKKLSLEAHQCVKPEQIPRGAAVITYAELISDITTSWEKLLFMTQKGWIPLIRENSRKALAEYLGGTIPVGRYYMIEALHFPWDDAEKAVSERFLSRKEQNEAQHSPE